jgi:hypothetical protein
MILAFVFVVGTGSALFGQSCRIDANGRLVCPTPLAVPSHSHVRTDGTILTHADTNYGNAASHAGVEWPWVKTSGSTTTSTVTSYSVGESYALDTSARAVLFPRVRSFVPTLSHNRQVRLTRIFHSGFFARFRR